MKTEYQNRKPTLTGEESAIISTACEIDSLRIGLRKIHNEYKSEWSAKALEKLEELNDIVAQGMKEHQNETL